MARVPRDETPHTLVGSSSPKTWRRGTGNRLHGAPGDAQAAAERRKRRMRVFELRAQFSATWDTIGAEVGISGKQAQKDYRRACLEYGQETAAEHKAKANARFDGQLATVQRLIARVRPIAEGIPDADPKLAKAPDLDAVAKMGQLVRTAERITKDQAEMNGAFAPKKVEHAGVDGGPIVVTLDDISEAITAARANRAGPKVEDAVH